MFLLSFHFFKRGNQATDKRYRLEMLAGYGFPLTVTVATLLVETFAERCSDYRPRFGEEQCFFTSELYFIDVFFGGVSIDDVF